MQFSYDIVMANPVAIVDSNFGRGAIIETSGQLELSSQCGGRFYQGVASFGHYVGSDLKLLCENVEVIKDILKEVEHTTNTTTSL